MWNGIKKVIIVASIATLAVSAHAVEWMTDARAAAARAEQENKAVLLDFTGSDWCIWCKRLKSEILDTAEFQSFAEANLILVEVDFPNSKPISREQLAANEQLAKTYGIEGYPTLIILDSHSKVLGRTGYTRAGTKAFIENIAQMIHKPAAADAPASAPAPAPAPPAAAPVPTPGPPMKLTYHQLGLRGITGTGQRKLALINNQTFSPGETASVQVDGQSIKLTCREIHDGSVTVEIGAAKPVELRLGQPIDIDKKAAVKN